MNRLLRVALAALVAALVTAPAARANMQTQPVPGVGTVTINERDGTATTPAMVDVTVAPAGGTVYDSGFAPIVFLNTGRPPLAPPELPDRSDLTLSAQGTGSDVTMTMLHTTAGSQTCQITGGPAGLPLTLATATHAVDGGSVTFSLPRGHFIEGLPLRVRWLAVNAAALTPADRCDTDGVLRDIVNGSFLFQGTLPGPPEVTGPAAGPAETPTAPAPVDIDGDGIRNDWLVGGAPAAAPKAPRAGRVTANAVTLKLPKAPAGAKLRVYRKTPGGGFALVATTTRPSLRVRRLKAGRRYQFKLVAVNRAGQQTAASKPLTVKTRKHR